MFSPQSKHQFIKNFILSREDAHVWHVDVRSINPIDYQILKSCLSQEEKWRANTFRFEKDRRVFIIARGYLRQLLACYLSIGAAQIKFSEGTHGKPALSDSLNKLNIKFNLSHSGSLIAYLITLEDEVGIDIEMIQEQYIESLAVQEILSKKEQKQWEELTKEQKIVAFFRFWVCKESILKSLGQGFFYSPSLVELDIASYPALLVNIGPDEGPQQRWSLQEYIPIPGYLGAIAIQSINKKISFHVSSISKFSNTSSTLC